jgi:bacteriocin biosynthesis cyclodehydratase domain-containing protein
VLRLDAERVQVRSPSGDVTFSSGGALVQWLADRAGEAVSLEVLRSEAEQRPDAAMVGAVLRAMIERRFLVPSAEAPADAYLALVQHYAKSMPRIIRAADDLHAGSVIVIGQGCLAQRALRTLRNLGIEVHHSADGHLLDEAGLHVAISDNDDVAAMERINRLAIAERRCLTFVRRTRSAVAIGPCVVPGETCCFSCYVSRQRGSSMFTAEFDAFIGGQAQRFKSYNTSPAVEGLVDFALVQHVSCLSSGLQQFAEPGRLYNWDLLSGQLQERAVLKLPRCEVCGLHAAQETPARAVRAVL